jgi:hypothetical protein
MDADWQFVFRPKSLGFASVRADAAELLVVIFYR